MLARSPHSSLLGLCTNSGRDSSEVVPQPQLLRSVVEGVDAADMDDAVMREWDAHDELAPLNVSSAL